MKPYFVHLIERSLVCRPRQKESEHCEESLLSANAQVKPKVIEWQALLGFSMPDAVCRPLISERMLRPIDNITDHNEPLREFQQVLV